MEHALQARPRIEVVDALRGFAVMAIILLHNIEHFNLYNFPEATTDFMKALDKGVWDTLFFLFSGKAYAIFALLFGFSFFIQFDNQARKGKDFRLRFFWRLVLLFFMVASTHRSSRGRSWCFIRSWVLCWYRFASWVIRCIGDRRGLDATAYGVG